MTAKPKRFVAARRWLNRLVTVVGIAILALTGVALVIAADEHFGMSASTPATIEGVGPATWYAMRGTRHGYAIRYSFPAGDVTYRDTENRVWKDVPAAAAKVCFDPADPAGRHVLVPGSYTCAGLNPFEDWGQW